MTEKKFDDDKWLYEAYHTCKEKEWESLCTRCGMCCGIGDNDPCEHLRAVADNQYECSIYENRFGIHRTASGKTFCCVPLRVILHQSWSKDYLCAYKKKINVV